MGYSSTVKAGNTSKAVIEQHRYQNSGNTFTTDGGKTVYFIERGREQADGAETGTVMKFVGADSCRRHGTYRVNPDGKIIRWAGLPKKYWAAAEAAGLAEYNRVYGKQPMFSVG